MGPGKKREVLSLDLQGRESMAWTAKGRVLQTLETAEENERTPTEKTLLTFYLFAVGRWTLYLRPRFTNFVSVVFP